MRLRVLRFIFVGVSALPAFVCLAQEPIKVTPCDLVTIPERYAGKLVEVRGRVDLAFENFTLAQPGCEGKYPRIWLMFGGDEPTPIASTVNDNERRPGSMMKVQGQPIPLIHDAALDLFNRRLNAERVSPIGDRPCYDCYLYDVTASLIGVFFQDPNGGRPMGGYGHMGCCHLLAIERVKDVNAERTSIPVGGSFQCKTEKKDLSAEEAKHLDAMDQSCLGLAYQACQDRKLPQMSAVAAYWNDAVGRNDGNLGIRSGGARASTQAWESNDKLKEYVLSISFTGKDARAVANGGTIARTACFALTPPSPSTAAVGCQNLWSKFEKSKLDLQSTAVQVSNGEEPWRLDTAELASKEAVKEAAHFWGIQLSDRIKAVSCDKPMVVNGDQFAWCNLSDADGWQSIGIQLTRFGNLRHGQRWERVPWILSRGRGTVCSIEP